MLMFQVPMTKAILHKYFDFRETALANLTLPSGERVVMSVVASGTFEVRRLHLSGFIPGKRLFRAYPLEAGHMAQVLARESHRLEPLPTATGQHRDESAMHESPDAVPADLAAGAGAIDVLQHDRRRERPLSLFTRLALSATDTDDLVRRYERVRNTPE